MTNKYQNAKKQTNKQTKKTEKEIKAQRTPTCCITDGSFTMHIAVSWMTLHQTITLLAKSTPHAIIFVWLNFVSSQPANTATHRINCFR